VYKPLKIIAPDEAKQTDVGDVAHVSLRRLVVDFPQRTQMPPIFMAEESERSLGA
jgi:hypothetical protein